MNEMEKSYKNKTNIFVSILCVLYILIELSVFVIYAFGIKDSHFKYAIQTFLIDNFLFFTKQTGILGMIFCITLLMKFKNEKHNNRLKTFSSYIGIICFCDFFYVNLFKIFFFNSATGWSGEPI